MIGIFKRLFIMNEMKDNNKDLIIDLRTHILRNISLKSAKHFSNNYQIIILHFK